MSARKLTNEEVRRIWTLCDGPAGFSSIIARKFGVSITTMRNIYYGKVYKEVTADLIEERNQYIKDFLTRKRNMLKNVN